MEDMLSQVAECQTFIQTRITQLFAGQERLVSHFDKVVGTHTPQGSTTLTPIFRGPRHDASQLTESGGLSALAWRMSGQCRDRCDSDKEVRIDHHQPAIREENAYASEATDMSTCSHMLPNDWPATLDLRPEYQCVRALSSKNVSRMDSDRSDKLGASRLVKSLSKSSRRVRRLSSRGSVMLASRWSRITSMNQWALNPHSSFMRSKDMLGIFMILHDLLVVPVLLSWDLQLEGSWRSLNWLLAMYWSSDFVLNIFTGFYVKGDLVVLQPAVALNYVRRWFAFDLLLVTFDWIGIFTILAYQEEKWQRNGASESFLAAVRFFRILKLLRLARLFRLLGKLSMWSFRVLRVPSLMSS